MNPSFGSSLDQRAVNGMNGGSHHPSTSAASTSSTIPSSPIPSNSSNGIRSREKALQEHVYDSYMNSRYSDIHLRAMTVDGTIELNLHSLIISISPYFRSLLNYHKRGETLSIEVPIFIRAAAFNVAIASLYSPLQPLHISPTNSFGIFCSAYLLELESLGLDALQVISDGITSTSITPDEIITLVDWSSFLSGDENSRGAFQLDSNGFDAFKRGGQEEDSNRITFIALAERLKEELYDRLIVKLPIELGVSAKGFVVGGSEGYVRLLEICSVLPFDWLKSMIESRSFPIDQDIDRFNLAKKIVSERKRRAVASGTGTEFEEAVVLQFGASSSTSGGVGGTAVSLLRKRNKKKLWKVHSE